MKFLIACSIIICNHCFSQENVRGNWLTITFWSCSYTKLKKSGKIKQFTANCKDSGTIQTGRWHQQNDTLYIITENKNAKFLLREGKLCEINSTGEACITKYGISRTSARSIIGAKRRIKRVRKRD